MTGNNTIIRVSKRFNIRIIQIAKKNNITKIKAADLLMKKNGRIGRRLKIIDEIEF